MWIAFFSGLLLGAIAMFCLFVIVGKRMESKEPIIYTNTPN